MALLERVDKGAVMPANRTKAHDLHDFMQQITDEMAAEYDRIQKRATEDPGTAGDQGEENWAELLRLWLPSHYHVVTKGRLINEHGETSPQVDVLVLRPSYPPKLRDKKLYLAAGVAAAFECKTTLKTAHIKEAVETCAKIKRLFTPWDGSAYEELHAPIVYGLLAHSHSWQGENSTPLGNIVDALFEADEQHADHPRLELDTLCVADLGTWSRYIRSQVRTYSLIDSSGKTEIRSYGLRDDDLKEAVFTGYYGPALMGGPDGHWLDPRSPIGSFLTVLYRKLSWKDPTVRDFVSYFAIALWITGHSDREREWPLSVYSEHTRKKLRSVEGRGSPQWSEWSNSFW